VYNCDAGPRRCNGCNQALGETEAFLCDDCYEAHIERCLASANWVRIRGPYVAEDFRAALVAIRARKAYAAVCAKLEEGEA